MRLRVDEKTIVYMRHRRPRQERVETVTLKPPQLLLGALEPQLLSTGEQPCLLPCLFCLSLNLRKVVIGIQSRCQQRPHVQQYGQPLTDTNRGHVEAPHRGIGSVLTLVECSNATKARQRHGDKARNQGHDNIQLPNVPTVRWTAARHEFVRLHDDSRCGLVVGIQKGHVQVGISIIRIG